MKRLKFHKFAADNDHDAKIFSLYQESLPGDLQGFPFYTGNNASGLDIPQRREVQI
jgi:hypothetical protein